MKPHRYIFSFSVKSKKKRRGIVEYLNKGTCFEINPSSFYFETTKNPIQIHKDWNKIEPLSLHDAFYVFSICLPWTGHGNSELKKNIWIKSKGNKRIEKDFRV